MTIPTKTIKINPDLFITANGGSSSKTKKNRSGYSSEKKQKPVVPIQINENSLKKKFLNRIKEHKNKEKVDSGVKNEIKVKESTAQSKNSEDPTQSDEFYDSIQYLSLLSRKKKEENDKKKHETKIQNKTVKNMYSNTNYGAVVGGVAAMPYVDLELPEELTEKFTVPENSSSTITLNSGSNSHFSDFLNGNSQEKSGNQNLQFQTQMKFEEEPPYGCLKGASKPTYRTWLKNKTKKNTNDTTIHTSFSTQSNPNSGNINFSTIPINTEPTSSSQLYQSPFLNKHQNDRQKKLELLRKKMKNDNDKMNHINNKYDNDGLKNDANYMSTFGSLGDGQLNIKNPLSEKNEPEKIYTKKTIRRKYTLGKSNLYRKVGILIKDNITRKKILTAHKELKKKPIGDIKKYLIEHGLFKIGSNAPSNVLRKTYESAMLTGDVINKNKDVLIHNLINDTTSSNN